MGGLSVDQARAIVERTCREQGVPVFVTAPDVLQRVWALLGGDGGAGAPRAQPRGRRRRRSQSPDRLHPISVDLAGTRGRRLDHDMVEHRAQDRPLSIQVERRPLSA